MIDNIKQAVSLTDSSFVIKDNFPFGGAYADLYCFRKGRNFVFPQRDYIFFHDYKSRNMNNDSIKNIHEQARKYVDSLYKMPKIMRFTVPNIASVFFSDSDFDKNLIDLVSQNTRSKTGGEIHQMLLLNTTNKTFYGQDLHTAHGRSGVVSVSMQFKNIDPQNRTIFLLKAIIEKM